MPRDLVLLSTLNGSNYPYLELIFMVPKVFEPLKFDCNRFSGKTQWGKNGRTLNYVGHSHWVFLMFWHAKVCQTPLQTAKL